MASFPLLAQENTSAPDRAIKGFFGLGANFASAIRVQSPFAVSGPQGLSAQAQAGVSVDLPTPVLSGFQAYVGYERSRLALTADIDFEDTDDDVTVEATGEFSLAWSELALGGRLYFLHDQPVRPFIGYTVYLANPRVRSNFEVNADGQSVGFDLGETAGPTVDALDLRLAKGDLTVGVEYALTPSLGLFASYTYRRLRLGLAANDLNEVGDVLAQSIQDLEDDGIFVGFDLESLQNIDGSADLNIRISTSFASLGLRMYF
jgi:hypothetical protein